MTDHSSASKDTTISHDNVVMKLQAVLRKAQADGWKDDDLEGLSGIPARTIKSYRVEGKEPSLSNALSLFFVLGPKATDPLLGLLGCRAVLIESDEEQRNLSELVSDVLQSIAVIAKAASDGRIDHLELPGCEDAADTAIRRLLTLASFGKK